MTIGATTKHELTTDGGTTYIQTANIANLTTPEESRGVSEDSYLDDVSGFKEFVAGVFDAGELTLDLKWNTADAGQTILDAAFENLDSDLAIVHGRITFSNDVLYEYDGIITSRGQPVVKEETMKRSYKIKVTGAPVWTYP